MTHSNPHRRLDVRPCLTLRVENPGREEPSPCLPEAQVARSGVWGLTVESACIFKRSGEER